jgi:hypothetical protein
MVLITFIEEMFEVKVYRATNVDLLFLFVFTITNISVCQNLKLIQPLGKSQ